MRAASPSEARSAQSRRRHVRPLDVPRGLVMHWPSVLASANPLREGQRFVRPSREDAGRHGRCGKTLVRRRRRKPARVSRLGTESSQTRRWSKADSNRWSHPEPHLRRTVQAGINATADNERVRAEDSNPRANRSRHPRSSTASKAGAKELLRRR
jgi:hypothetical protein